LFVSPVTTSSAIARSRSVRASPAASVTVVCPAGCSGTATALPFRGAKVLARKRFSARAGRPKKVTLRFDARGRRAVRVVLKAGGQRVKLTLRRR
jgi:hypothetical protein